jgi:hypothetical protein
MLRFGSIVVLFAWALVLIVAASALAVGHTGHIDLANGLTLAEQFAYAPEYRQNVVTFDANNQPTIRSRGASQDDTSFVHRLQGGIWIRHDILQPLRDAYPEFAGTVNAGGFASDRVDFDVDGRAYSVLTVRINDEGDFRNVLLASSDGCDTWSVVELPFGNDTPLFDATDRGNVTSEHDSGRLLQGPPLIAVWRQTAPWTGEWASLNDLYVVQPVWSEGVLKLQEPVHVSTQALGMTQAAGGASFAVTSGDDTFIAYSTVAPRGALLTPTYAATYDHSTNTIGPSTRVAGSRPANNCHVTPGICMDSAGILHIVAGAHGEPFVYARSTSPLSTAAWARQIRVLDCGFRSRTTDADGRGMQTYLSMVIGPDDVLHIACRQGRRNVDSHFRGKGYNALVHQSLAPGQGSWSRPDLIVVPPLPGYSQYYQKLTIDRLGRLFVSCSYFSPRDPPATRHFRRFHHRMVLISEDGGHAWRFATTADFLAGIPQAEDAAGT